MQEEERLQPETVIGRARERAALRGLLDDARSSRSRSLVIVGEPGVGKSTLIAATAAEATDFRILRSRGVETESSLPFAGIHQLLRPVLALLDRLPLAQSDALRVALGLELGATANRFLISLGVLSLLSELAESSPVCCVIDDGHWVDEPSLDALLFVARRVEAEGIALIVAARTGASGRIDDAGLDTIQLGGFDAETAQQMLELKVGSTVPGAVVDRLVAATAGNPLALSELGSILSPEELSGSRPLRDPLPITASVERAYLGRWQSLGTGARTLLLTAAADDAGWLPSILDAAARLGASEADLAECERSTLIQVGTRLEFRHPLIRSTVYQAASSAERRAVHAALADVLADPEDADRRAWHRAAASFRPNAEIAADLAAAGERARARAAFPLAARAFARAAVLSASSAERSVRYARAGECAWESGAAADASAYLDQARQLTEDSMLRADIDRLRGVIAIATGMSERGIEILLEAADEVAPVDGSRALRLLAHASEPASAGPAGELSIALGERAEAIEPPDLSSRFLRGVLMGYGRFHAGETAIGVRHLRDAIDAVMGSTESHLLFAAGRAAFFVGDDEASRAIDTRILETARNRGAAAFVPMVGTRVALMEILGGRFEQGRATAMEQVRLARSTTARVFAGPAMSMVVLAEAMRGDTQACRQAADEAVALSSRITLAAIEDMTHWGLGVLDAGAGRWDDALARLSSIAHPTLAIASSFDRADAAVRSGELRAAASLLESMTEFAEASGVAWASGRVAYLRALLAPEEAERRFAESLGHYARADRPSEEARVGLAFGEWLRRNRQRVRARNHLRTALHAFENLGMSVWADRARSELRASGETTRRSQPSTREQLTPQEHNVATFVGRGLSNRAVAAQLFLSPRTVDFHLRNVYAKLGVTSRTELASMFASQSTG